VNKIFWNCAAGLLLLMQPLAAYADTNAEQQEKEQETKNRIYGTKHPWENTEPYGTQYTPPSSPPGAADEVTKQAATDNKKPVVKKKTTKKHAAKHAAVIKKTTVKQTTTVQKKS
jgi:hypothetical protein